MMGPVLRLCSPLFSCLYRLVTTILAGLVTSHGHGAQTGAGVPVETVAFRRIRLFFFLVPKNAPRCHIYPTHGDRRVWRAKKNLSAELNVVVETAETATTSRPIDKAIRISI